MSLLLGLNLLEHLYYLKESVHGPLPLNTHLIHYIAILINSLDRELSIQNLNDVVIKHSLLMLLWRLLQILRETLTEFIRLLYFLYYFVLIVFLAIQFFNQLRQYFLSFWIWTAIFIQFSKLGGLLFNFREVIVWTRLKFHFLLNR